MTIENIKKYFLSKKEAYEDYPFDDVTPVYKVKNKMFALINSKKPLSINLKCDPELAVDLRDVYEEITPGYHMSKRHWNTINCEGNLPDEEIKKLIEMSYELVVKSLPKKERENLI